MTHENDLIETLLEDETETIELIIEIDEGRTVTLQIKTNDDPIAIAKQLCYTYDIDPKVIEELAKTIRAAQTNLPNQTRASYQHSFTRHQSSISHDEVFDRLYQHARSKANMRASVQSEHNQSYSSLTRRQSSKKKCIAVYQKNMRLKNQTHRKAQLLKQKQELEEARKYNYQPSIDPVSELIVERMKTYGSATDRINSAQQKHLLKVRDYLRQKNSKQLAECTFVPHVLTKSRILASNRPPVHTQRSMLCAYVGKEQLFRPKINEVSAQIVQGKTFFQRMNEAASQKEQKMDKLRRQSQLTAKPMTGRPPANRPCTPKTVGQYLYEKTKQKTTVVKPNPMNYSHVTRKSELIYEQNKQAALAFVFSLLDSDHDGIISSIKINILDLQPEVLRLISPLLAQMQEIDTQLNREQFDEAMERLYKTLSVAQRNVLINAPRQNYREQPQIPSFQPTLNQNSMDMLRGSRRPSGSLYDLWREAEPIKMRRIQQQRVYYEQLEQSEYDIPAYQDKTKDLIVRIGASDLVSFDKWYNLATIFRFIE